MDLSIIYREFKHVLSISRPGFLWDPIGEESTWEILGEKNTIINH